MSLVPIIMVYGQRDALAQQVAESGAVKNSGPGPLLPPPTDAADTVPCDGVQPATVLPR